MHVDTATYERLLALRQRTGLSFGQLVLRSLGEVELEVDRIFRGGWSTGYREGKTVGQEETYAKGFADGVERHQLVATCIRCFEPVALEAGSELGETAVGLLTANGPLHDSCEPKWTLVRRLPGR